MLSFFRTKWKLLSIMIVGCLLLSFLAVNMLIGKQVREAICVAQALESGDSVSALLAVANSTEHSLSERNSAVWALGQIGSSRALESLESLYSGENCDHSSDLCQHGLEKAISLCRGELNVGALVWRRGDLALP